MPAVGAEDRVAGRVGSRALIRGHASALTGPQRAWQRKARNKGVSTLSPPRGTYLLHLNTADTLFIGSSKKTYTVLLAHAVGRGGRLAARKGGSSATAWPRRRRRTTKSDPP